VPPPVAVALAWLPPTRAVLVQPGCREGVEEEEGKGRVGVVRGGGEAGRSSEIEGIFWEYGEDVCVEVACVSMW